MNEDHTLGTYAKAMLILTTLKRESKIISRPLCSSAGTIPSIADDFSDLKVTSIALVPVSSYSFFAFVHCWGVRQNKIAFRREVGPWEMNPVKQISSVLPILGKGIPFSER